MNATEIGAKIKERRKSLNITQREFAMLAGVGLNTLVSIERGVGNPNLANILQILDALGLKLSISLK